MNSLKNQADVPAALLTKTPTPVLSIPQDICDWVSPAELITWLREEVALLAQREGPTGPAAGDLKDPSFTVLALAYARGVFDPEEIVELSESDPLYQGLSNGLRLGEPAIKTFRRKDRRDLVRLLSSLIERAVKKKLLIETGTIPRELRILVETDANERVDTARHFDRGNVV